MENQIFLFFLFALAAVGLVEVCSGVTRWLCRSCQLENSYLVVVAQGRDEGIEGRLTQACNEVCLNRSIRGAKVVLVSDGTDPETAEICRRLCGSRGVLYVEDPGELGRALL